MTLPVFLTASYARLQTIWQSIESYAQSALLLLLRLHLVQVFFLAGLTKIRDWDTTIALFTDEYTVPFLPPALAAAGGAFGELVFPALLLIGLAGRLPALGLFAVNLVAVISYPSALFPEGYELATQAWHSELLGQFLGMFYQPMTPALKDHFYWGLLLLVLAVFGSGRIAIDRFLCKSYDSVKKD
ncbi:DoxX family protein [Parvibium lacunae]|uniref:DoxX family protein n=1 Tax=Parvibium lacunae TaxID=1888893 RepID=A0A368L1E1_9BURK|nr:DoxX family protein [Parvibium lacunae]RCS57379.1 DoxX family protein [Parvibium lacunae]